MDPSGGTKFSVRRRSPEPAFLIIASGGAKGNPLPAPERRNAASGGLPAEKSGLSDDKRRALERQKEKRPNFFGLLRFFVCALLFQRPGRKGAETGLCGGPDQRAGTELLQLPRSERGRPAPERGADNAFRPFGLLRREEPAPERGASAWGLSDLREEARPGKGDKCVWGFDLSSSPPRPQKVSSSRFFSPSKRCSRWENRPATMRRESSSASPKGS